MGKPFASVLIDTYNHERFIEQAIVSVLEQDFPASDMEILVVDDGSTDHTPEIVRKFEPRVRLLRKENGGQASAFNTGIPECRGEIIAFLDGDDWWTPKKLSRVSHTLAENLSLGIVGHGTFNVQRDGRVQEECLCEGFCFQVDTVEGALLFRRRGSFLGTSRMTIRTDLLRRIGLVPKGIEIQADEYLFTLAAALGGVRILPEALTYYRLHEGNSFQLARHDLEKLRRKQKSLEILAKSLLERLGHFSIELEVRRAAVEYTQACADQLRLILDGGWPWETVKTEWSVYEVVHPDASFSHRLFKHMILLTALFLPPKVFYGAQRRLAQSSLYKRTRTRVLPVPQMPHIEREWRARS